MWVAPSAQVWFDVWVPRDDELWDDDVVRAGVWLGEAWVRALDTLGAPGFDVHTGRATCTSWSKAVCFAGVGPGEVTRGVTKLVGISQRRTREGARFHTSVPLAWDPAALVGLFAWDSDRARRALDELAGVGTGLREVLLSPGDPVEDGELLAGAEQAFFDALPTGSEGRPE